jgi:hypothetical protein
VLSACFAAVAATVHRANVDDRRRHPGKFAAICDFVTRDIAPAFLDRHNILNDRNSRRGILYG